ncbi:Rad52/Rad22 family DNA repair protein [Nocardia sp. NPDC051570]|uniref:Rad52/Rad22 family DNA repair protein n=1 Tax=Nocardia sp. NPDC051570 TaxID=3364324 RepID=UPI0037AB9B87
MPFTPAQVDQLLAAINPVRVMKDGKGNSHLPQQDVLAHLIRIFGFGGFDYEVISLDLIFEQQHVKRDGTRPDNRYDVCYKALMRLTVRDPHGQVVTRLEDGSTGDASNQSRADGHDLAMKSAISLAKKRCAIALGDQFGLSLYNKGQLSKLVGKTLVHPGKVDTQQKDVQADVPESKSLGIDETERERHISDDAKAAEPQPESKPSGPPSVADRARAAVGRQTGRTITEEDCAQALRVAIDAAITKETLQEIWKSAADLPPALCEELRERTKARAAALTEVAA